MRDFAHHCLLSYLFWGVLEITYSQDATMDIDTKYVKRCGSVQGCVFWGLQNHTLTSTPRFSPKTAILGPDFDGTYKFSAENSFNIRRAKSKQPLNVIVVP